MTSAAAAVMRGFRWLARNWHIPLLTLVAVAGWVIGSRRRTPAEVVTDELDAIDQALQVERLAVDKGARLANEIVDHDYRRTIGRLDAAQRRRADDLRRDPGKRLRYLRRLSDQLGK